MKPEEMVGRVCVCQKGKIGTIESFRVDSQGVLYEGTRLFSPARWASRKPIILNSADVAEITKTNNAPEAPVGRVERSEIHEGRMNLSDASTGRRKRSKPIKEE